ncbi:uncharacterized protein LOC116845000 [Odontomachus brunneus]|uniref:uncharacterized protein LOC116845000 n=1 Tax=Odontomachus brunneus TaxID=486640 RepID=UPI0013F2A0B4|nr:uncharacterized protein LOC116845000 [Odontomachus brunneus]
MNFLFKFVKSRKTISNISDLTSKHSINELHSIKTNELTEKLGSSNISKNQIRSSKKDDIINKLPKSMSATVNASAIVASTSSSIPSTFHSPSHSVLKSCSHNSDNYSQRNMEEPDKHKSSEFDSDDDFSSSHNPNPLSIACSNKKIFPPLEYLETSENKAISPAAYSTSLLNSKISYELDRELVSPTLSFDSSSGMSSNLPKRFKKNIKRTSSADKKEESFLKLTSVVSSHLENKAPNVTFFDAMDEDDIFAKAVACQLKKNSELKNLN